MKKELLQLKTILQTKTPLETCFKLLEGNNTPVGQNLLKMAKNNDLKGIETFARNFFKEQGRNFDEEFKEFMSFFK